MPRAKSARPTVLNHQVLGTARPERERALPFSAAALDSGVKSCKCTRIIAGQALEDGLGRPLRWSSWATATWVLRGRRAQPRSRLAEGHRRRRARSGPDGGEHGARLRPGREECKAGTAR